MVQVPLFGAIIWIATSMSSLMIGNQGRQAWQGEASFCASILTYLVCVTILHLLHKGHGRGRRRMGKTRRMTLRGFMLLILIVWTVVTSSPRTAITHCTRSTRLIQSHLLTFFCAGCHFHTYSTYAILLGCSSGHVCHRICGALGPWFCLHQ